MQGECERFERERACLPLSVLKRQSRKSFQAPWPFCPACSHVSLALSRTPSRPDWSPFILTLIHPPAHPHHPCSHGHCGRPHHPAARCSIACKHAPAPCSLRNSVKYRDRCRHRSRHKPRSRSGICCRRHNCNAKARKELPPQLLRHPAR